MLLILYVQPLVALRRTQASANAMARTNLADGKIVLVSSTLGLIGLVGYSQYAPMKHAIRGTSKDTRLKNEIRHEKN